MFSAQLKSAISDDQIAVFLALGGGWENGPNLRSARIEISGQIREGFWKQASGVL
jgi:hypothetical protein